MTKNIWLAILSGGFIAGTFDIGAAALFNWLNPIFVLQIVARGVLGKDSFSQGAFSASLGMILQWAMSLLIAAIFVFAAARLPVLRRRWIAAGLAYGVVVFFVMNYVVVPLSMVGAAPHFTLTSFCLNMLAMLMFGLIIAFYAQRFSTNSA
jgi:hypothetical protein